MFLMLLLFHSKAEGNHPRLKRICIAVDGKITVSWYNYNDTCNKFNKVLIFGRRDQFSNYTLIDSIKNFAVNSYLFVNGINYLKGSFFLEYISKCPGDVVSISDTLDVDVNPPPQTDPDSVSVNADGSVIVGWSTNPTASYADTKSFILYNVKSGNFPIDTVYRNMALFAVDKINNANVGPVSYRLSPVDSCDNVAALGNIHTTAFLSATQDSCKYTVTLSWTGYIGWQAGVKYYEVYYSQDIASGYKYAGNAIGTSFDVKGLTNLTGYYFFVRAVKNSTARITASSNSVSIVTAFEKDFSYVYIKTVSVEGSAIRIDWSTSSNRQVGYSQLYRGRNTGAMKLIATVPGTSLVNNLFTYIDKGVDVENDVWLYKVVSFNTCGHLAGTSNIPHNILLKLDKSGRAKNLSWNSYDTWSGGVMLYDIDRTVSDGKNMVQSIGQEGSGNLSFVDDDSVLNYGRPGICYQVRALEGDGDKYGFVAESFSNTVCYIDPPVVYIPNAFVPDEGVNKIFRPVISYADTLETVFSVYNRWGELIYESKGYKLGWDGRTHDGRNAPLDVYFYYVKVLGLDNTISVYKGTFTLL